MAAAAGDRLPSSRHRRRRTHGGPRRKAGRGGSSPAATATKPRHGGPSPATTATKPGRPSPPTTATKPRHGGPSPATTATKPMNPPFQVLLPRLPVGGAPGLTRSTLHRCLCTACCMVRRSWGMSEPAAARKMPGRTYNCSRQSLRITAACRSSSQSRRGQCFSWQHKWGQSCQHRLGQSMLEQRGAVDFSTDRAIVFSLKAILDAIAARCNRQRTFLCVPFWCTTRLISAAMGNVGLKPCCYGTSARFPEQPAGQGRSDFGTGSAARKKCTSSRNRLGCMHSSVPAWGSSPSRPGIAAQEPDPAQECSTFRDIALLHDGGSPAPYH